ncbi:hypothetical protein I9Y15_004787 [Serratia marcescens]
MPFVANFRGNDVNYYRTTTAVDVLNTLKAYHDDLQDPPLHQPYCSLLKRLISRETEMTPMWDNIVRQGLLWPQCHTLLEQILFAGAYGTKERNTRLKVDRRRLVDLNVGIATKAAELATMMTEREYILNRDAFSVERTTHIVDLIDAASEQNGHYCSFLREPLDGLRCQYDGKCWPSLQQLLQVVAHETLEAEFL